MSVSELNINDVIRAHTGNWFDKDTMRFWGTRLPQTAFEAADGTLYFVSSEYTDHRRTGRGFTIRKQLTDGSIVSVSALNQYDTRAQANRALKELLNA